MERRERLLTGRAFYICRGRKVARLERARDPAHCLRPLCALGTEQPADEQPLALRRQASVCISERASSEPAEPMQCSFPALTLCVLRHTAPLWHTVAQRHSLLSRSRPQSGAPFEAAPK